MFQVQHFSEIDSTQFEAKRLIASGQITEKTVISAERQTAGMGSRGRKWESERDGNLLATWIIPFRPETTPAPQHAAYVIALAIHQTLTAYLPKRLSLKIKWPNDILLEEKKISGALHEIEVHDGQSFFLAGIGINLTWHPEDTNFPATHLKEYAEKIPETKELRKHLGYILENKWESWHRKGFEPIRAEMKPHLYRLGQNITIQPNRVQENCFQGIFKEIDAEGALVLETSHGLKKFMTGDIFPGLTSHACKQSA